MNKDQKEFRKLAREALKLFQKKEWGASIAVWDKIISLLQDDLIKASAYTRRGNAKDEAGDREDAIADYNRAMEINPQYARAYSNRSISKHNMGDHKGAIADCDRALKINPQYAKAYLNRGNAKKGMGDHEGAIADYNRAMEISPQYEVAYNNRGNTKSNMGDHEGAIADYDRAIEINPQYEGTYNNRGNVKDNMGDHEGAIAEYDRAIEINPRFAMAYSNRGNTKSKMGDYEGAIADYDRVLEIDPEHERAFRNRDVARAMQESQEEGQKIKGQLLAQMRAQQKEFASTMQKQVQALEKKLDEKFEEKFQAVEDIAKALEYDDNFRDYSKKAKQIGWWVWGLSGALALAAIAVYGYIACFGIEAWQAAQSPMAMSNFSALSLFPFILMGTLLLSPLVWVIRMLNRDKHKCWVLREDALANLTLARIIKSYPTLRKELSERLFEHHDKRGSASLIADWKRADTGGNSVSIQDILNLVKPSDKGSN